MEGNKICIIGGSGSLGEALIVRYSKNNQICVISRDELKQWQLKQKYPSVAFRLCDIRNYDSLMRMIKNIGPDIVINCAALKHIDICESNIGECIDTNITGTRNVINVCSDVHSVKTVLFISTDKACYPINAYGMSKSISERLMVEASTKSSKKFVCVRYGNVLNSRGSLIPKFKELADNKDCDYVPVTSDKMTRFFMKIEESVDLIENAIVHGDSGDTWIPNIPSFKIIDLAKYVADKYSKKIKIIGVRPGEKFHECLVNQDEISRTTTSRGCYVIKPCYQNYNFNVIPEEYTSEDTADFKLLIPIIEELI